MGNKEWEAINRKVGDEKRRERTESWQHET